MSVFSQRPPRPSEAGDCDDALAPRRWPEERLRESLRREGLDRGVTTVAKNTIVYAAGDPADSVFLVETGLVKIVTLSASGRECLLAIHGSGEVFGELSLREPEGGRLETAMAMTGATVRVIPRDNLAERLRADPLLGSLIRCLAARLSQQQELITRLATADSEQRLAETLLMLARRLGRRQVLATRIEPAVSHEELSQMVGTTRPRITTFMTRFRALGLVGASSKHVLVVNERKLAAHLGQLE